MSTRLLVTVLAACILLTITSTVVAKELYRWKDENGVTHYSDTKPEGADFERREVATDPVPAASAEPSAASSQPAPGAAKPAAKPEPTPECLQARSNLETLNTAEAVSMDTDGDGVPETLEGDARQRAVVGAYELAQKLCVP